MIYFDYAANTPCDPNVLDCFTMHQQMIGNANSPYLFGEEAAECIAKANASIAAHCFALPNEIIHTSGATESNNLALLGIAYKHRSQGKHIISTFLEHASVHGPLAKLESDGFEIDYVRLLADGTVDLKHLHSLLRSDTICVSIAYVDSEIGIIQPIQQIAELLLSYPNCLFHVDATQAIGKIPVSFNSVDAISFAPHKFYGITGSGVLILRENVLIEPLFYGGLSLSPFRSGTAPTALIAACAKALDISIKALNKRLIYVESLNQQLRQFFQNLPRIIIHSPESASPFILNIGLDKMKNTLFQAELANRGIALSTKSACSHPNTPSKAIYALIGNRKQAMSTLRVSISHLTTQEELEHFFDVFSNVYEQFANK